MIHLSGGIIYTRTVFFCSESRMWVCTHSERIVHSVWPMMWIWQQQQQQQQISVPAETNMFFLQNLIHLQEFVVSLSALACEWGVILHLPTPPPAPTPSAGLSTCCSAADQAMLFTHGLLSSHLPLVRLLSSASAGIISLTRVCLALFRHLFASFVLPAE